MSFSWNPYAHMSLVTPPPKGQRVIHLSQADYDYWNAKPHDIVQVSCDGCGASDVGHGRVRLSDPISVARTLFDGHVKASHGSFPDDFASWSWQ